MTNTTTPKVALITGITGQDGSNPAEFLMEKGYTVHGIKRRASSFNTARVDHIYQDPHVDNARFKLHYGDLSDSSNLTRIIQETQPDEIYNLGAQSHVAVSFESPEYTADVDGMGTLRMLEAIRILGLEKKTRFCPSLRGASATRQTLHARTCWGRGLPRFARNDRKGPSLRGVSATRQTMHAWTCWGRGLPRFARNDRKGPSLRGAQRRGNQCLSYPRNPRRGETFVTRKITRGMANISQGLEGCLYMGIIDGLRDCGHAKDYVRMQWMMLQQDQPEDFCIATGVQYSVRQFINWTAEALGMQLRWEGEGVNEVAYWLNPLDCRASLAMTDSVRPCEERSDAAIHAPIPVVRIDPRYFRPTEVETLLGDPSKAKQKLGWVPEITAQDMCKEMVANDLAQAKQHALLKANGYVVNVSVEGCTFRSRSSTHT